MPRKKTIDTLWRLPKMEKCRAPKGLGKAPRCGKPFPAYGVTATCSDECSKKLELEGRRKGYKVNAPEIIAAQAHRWRAKPRECESCHEIYQPRKNSRTCTKPECLAWLKAQQKAEAHQYYLDNRENWESEAQKSKKSDAKRAKRLLKKRSCLAVIGGKICGKRIDPMAHPKVVVCCEEHRLIRRRHMARVIYAADIETSQAKVRDKATRRRQKAKASQKEDLHV